MYFKTAAIRFTEQSAKDPLAGLSNVAQRTAKL